MARNALAALFLASMLPAPAIAAPDEAPAARGQEREMARTILNQARRILDSLYRAQPNAGHRYADEVAAGLAAVGDFQAAEALFGQRKSTGRFHDVSLRCLAVGYARGGDMARARATIARIRDAEPDYARQKPLAWLHSGLAFAKAGRGGEAAEAFAEAVRSTPRSERFPEQEGLFLAEVAAGQYQAGQPAESEATFRSAIARVEEDRHLRTHGLLEIAAIRVRLGLLPQAEATIERIADPRDRQWGWSKLVETEAEAGRLDEASRLTTRIDGVPAARAGLVLAAARFKVGHLREARRALEQAEAAARRVTVVAQRIQIDGQLAESRAMLGDREAAADWLKEATALALGASIAVDGRAPSAIERQIEQVPGAMFRKSSLIGIAAIQAKLGFVDDARRSFDRAKAASRDLQPGLWQNAAITMLAKTQAEAGLPDDAMRTLESLPQANLKWLDYVPVAVARAKAGDFAGARHVVDLHRADAHSTRSYIAQALLEAGDLDNALRVALRSSPWSEEVVHDAARRIVASDRKLPLPQPLDAFPPEVRVAVLAGAAEGLLDRAGRSASKSATNPTRPGESPRAPTERPGP